LVYGQKSEVTDKCFLCKRNEGKPVKLFKKQTKIQLFEEGNRKKFTIIMEKL
jgi:hypothetical protein